MDIKSICESIRSSKLQPRQLFEKFPDFAEQYPTLFQACVNKSNSLEYLDHMLDMVEKIEKRTVSVENADKDVYSILNDKYVNPVLKS